MGYIKKDFKIRVLLIKEASMWAAQCLEFDIAAQGETQDEAKEAFGKTFLGQIALDISENREPLEDIAPAPQEFLDMFEKTEDRPKDPRRFCVPKWILEGFIIDAQANDMRVAYAT